MRPFLFPGSRRRNFRAAQLFKDVSPEALTEFYASFHLLAFDQAIIDVYCRLWVSMARAGRAPDYPDLWTAACAVTAKIPILTRNPKHFADIPELEVIGYKII
jgi:predicted nucleic acid-binding protein